MGETAENVAKRYQVSRADQEVLAVESHRKAAETREQGRLGQEIIPIRTGRGELVSADGCIRPGTSLEALAKLKPVFSEHGVVTAGTASPLTDGASGVGDERRICLTSRTRAAGTHSCHGNRRL